VESDYLNRANVDVIRGEIGGIDLNNNTIKIKGHKEIIKFDKLLIAWGAHKSRLREEKSYSNIYYLEDRQSHARVHNEILKAKNICIMGGTFEAY
jgi:NADH dehydrogenase FAD-containing subunit